MEEDLKQFWAWILSGITIVVVGMGKLIHSLIKKFYDTRFNILEGRMAAAEEDVSSLKRESSKQDKELGEIRTHIRYIKENTDKNHASLINMHDKIDQIHHVVKNGNK